MKRLPAQRIAPLGGIRTHIGQRNTEPGVRRTPARDRLRIVGRERNALTVVDRPARQEADDVQHTRVVLEAAPPVGLHAEVGLRDVLVRADDLDVDHHRQQRERKDAKRSLEPVDRDPERFEIR